MKKLILFFCLIPLGLGTTSFANLNTKSKQANIQSRTSINYAQIKQDTSLFKKNDNEYIAITTLPETYFVALLGECNSDGYYKASYLDLDGYVKQTSIDIVDFEPMYKFGTGDIKINNPEINSINLRSQPDHNNDDYIIDQIAKTNVSMKYYGVKDGTSLGNNNMWYFIQVQIDDEIVHGYVYGTNMACEPIPENQIVKVEPPAQSEDASKVQPPMNDTTVYVFIAILSAPVVLIMFLLFKKRQPQARQHSDN